MTLQEFLERIAEVEARAGSLISSASSPAELEAARTSLVGRKSGALSALMKELPSLSQEERPEAGAQVNLIKMAVEDALNTRGVELAGLQQSAGSVDLTMPARRTWKGGKHPVTLVIEEIEEIFRELGFTIALGPEAETEWYNFSALNFPPIIRRWTCTTRFTSTTACSSARTLRRCRSERSRITSRPSGFSRRATSIAAISSTRRTHPSLRRSKDCRSMKA